MIEKLAAFVAVVAVVAMFPFGHAPAAGSLHGARAVTEVGNVHELLQGPIRGQPLVMRGFARLQGWSPSEVDLPSTLHNVKRRTDSPHFVYQNRGAKSGPAPDYEVVPAMPRREFLAELAAPDRWVYWTAPGRWAEEVLKPLRSGVGAPSVNLWVGSQGATATAHYDEEHNYFLQLHGRKTFRLAPPEWALRSGVHSSLHSGWRQARDLLPDALVGAAGWQVTLSPGDVLYLPPFWMHWVTAETVSVSANAWTVADTSQTVVELGRLPLPQNAPDLAPADRAAALLDFVGETALKLFGSVEPLAEALTARAELTTEGAGLLGGCQAVGAEVRVVGVRSASIAAAGLLAEGSESNEQVALLLLADFAEELALGLFGSVEQAERFLVGCLAPRGL